jgi:hypothetical protein
MKKFTIIGLSLVAVVACLLLFWQHARASRDKSFSQKLAGTWSLEFDNIRETRNFAADGSFTGQTVTSHPKGTNTNQMAGTWYIKAGRFIETVTSNSNPKARVPRTVSGQVVRIDAHEYVVAYDTNILVLNRVTP